MWGVLSLLIGFLYGWMKPGTQDKSQLFVRGLIFGIVIALVLAVLGYTIGSNPVYFGSGIFGLILGVVIIALLFVLGVWLGDLLEGRPKRST
jgi:peptidoglycan/LPS O-acetylase OafA/YrhL